MVYKVFCCTTKCKDRLPDFCQNNKACLKECNIKGHNNSIHSKKYDKISGQLRVDKSKKLRKITARSTKNNFDS